MVQQLLTLPLFAVATLLNSVSAGNPLCISGYIYDVVLGRCYKIYRDGIARNMTFDESEDLCRQDGGHLASIHSVAQNEYLRSLTVPNTLWIGLRYSRPEGRYSWTDHSVVDYNDVVEPRPEYDCVVINYNSVGDNDWVTRPCDDIQNFICFLGGDSDSTTTSSAFSQATSSIFTAVSQLSSTPFILLTTTQQPQTTLLTSTLLPTTMISTSTTTKLSIITSTTNRPSTQPVTSAPGKCPSGWLSSAAIPRVCYFVYDSALVDYFNAIRYCNGIHAGSHVLTVLNGFQNSEVRDLITSSSIWLGLDRSSGDWAWSDGETGTYRNWGAGQPASQGDCSIVRRNDGKWAATDCDLRLPVICELTV